MFLFWLARLCGGLEEIKLTWTLFNTTDITPTAALAKISLALIGTFPEVGF